MELVQAPRNILNMYSDGDRTRTITCRGIICNVLPAKDEHKNNISPEDIDTRNTIHNR